MTLICVQLSSILTGIEIVNKSSSRENQRLCTMPCRMAFLAMTNVDEELYDLTIFLRTWMQEGQAINWNTSIFLDIVARFWMFFISHMT